MDQILQINGFQVVHLGGLGSKDGFKMEQRRTTLKKGNGWSTGAAYFAAFYYLIRRVIVWWLFAPAAPVFIHVTGHYYTNMKKYLTLLFITTLLIGCNSKTMTSSELVAEYYGAFNSSDFNRLNSIIADSITIVEGEYVMPYSKESFYEQFKWDSVFQPTYKIVEIEDLNNHIIATVASSSIRYKFLKNDPLTCRFRIFFNSNEITKIESLDCLDADWNIWQTERDSLVNWTRKNHPELDGFIHNLTMNGAINYLKAIELYEKRKNAL